MTFFCLISQLWCVRVLCSVNRDFARHKLYMMCDLGPDICTATCKPVSAENVGLGIMIVLRAGSSAPPRQSYIRTDVTCKPVTQDGDGFGPSIMTAKHADTPDHPCSDIMVMQGAGSSAPPHCTSKIFRDIRLLDKYADVVRQVCRCGKIVSNRQYVFASGKLLSARRLHWPFGPMGVCNQCVCTGCPEGECNRTSGIHGSPACGGEHNHVQFCNQCMCK